MTNILVTYTKQIRMAYAKSTPEAVDGSSGVRFYEDNNHHLGMLVGFAPFHADNDTWLQGIIVENDGSLVAVDLHKIKVAKDKSNEPLFTDFSPY